MKNVICIILAAFLLIGVAGSAMALEGDFSGHYEVWGVSHDHRDLQPDSATISYLEMELDMYLKFKVSDNLSLITSFTALERRWGDNQSEGSALSGSKSSLADSGDFAWREAFMIVKTKIGGFVIGRMPDGPWGTPFNDTTDSADRFNWVIPYKKWRFAYTYEKWTELDSEGTSLSPDPTDLSDADNDKHYLSAQFKDEDMRAGLLFTYYDIGTLIDLGNTTTIANFEAGIIPSFQRPVSADAFIFSPYFISSFGNFDVNIEGTYGFGEAEYEFAGAQSPFNPLGDTPRDVEVWTYWGELKYNIGKFAIFGGISGRSGDVLGQDDDDEFTSSGFLEEGGDWGKTFILFNRDYSGLAETLGGAATNDPIDPATGLPTGRIAMGNNAGPGVSSADPQSQTTMNGYHMYYFGLQYAALNNLNFEFIFASSKADEVLDRPAQVVITGAGPVAFAAEKWDDDHGMEYNLNATWDIFDNLQMKGTLAYLDAGDYWQQGDSTRRVEDLFSAFTLLSLSF